MLRTVLGVVAGFLAWVIAWVGSEKVLSALWPDWYGAHQLAFTAAIKSGAPFAADATILLIHIACAAAITVVCGFVAARVARENRRAPLALGLLLTALGVLKMVMSWPYVPLWYHVVFTALLLPMAILGGRLKPAARR